MQPLRIQIVDDHPLMRRALQTAVIAEPDIEVVGLAANGRQALELIAETQPDIVLVDLLMPFGGPENIATLRQQYPDLKILVVTSVSEGEMVLQAIQAGAQGYITKEADHAELLQAIRTVGAGNMFLPVKLAGQLLSQVQKESAQIPEPKTAVSLTKREQAIFKLLGDGLTNNEIADKLTLSPSTVRVHLRNILQKYHFISRSEAVAYAAQHKLKK